MTTQTESSSPFGASVDNKTTETAPILSFRTMQDDLLNIKKSDTPIADKIKTEFISEKKSPIIEAPAKQATQQTPPKTPENLSPNPFLEKTVSETAPVSKMEMPTKQIPATENFPPRETKIVEIPQEKIPSQNAGSSKFKIIFTIIVFLIISIIGLAGYYFWLTSSQQIIPPVTEPVVEITVPTIEEPPVIEVPVEKYSSTKPNYITIDLATSSSEEIQSTISTIANDSQNLTSSDPYEFIVVDSNNNPVAFPIFATAAKLNFSQAVLSSLGESFSLYLYNDNGAERLGLSVSVLKTDTLATEIRKQEKTLPTDLSLMFLGVTPEIKTGVFKDATYDSYKSRYLNLNTANTLSIDYAVKDTLLFVGTSKQTLKAILDKQILTSSQAPDQKNMDDANLDIATPTADPKVVL